MYYRSELSPMYRTAVSPMYPSGLSPVTPTDLPEMGAADKALWARVSNVDDSGRERVPWGRELWDRIDRAVHDEMCRVGVGRQFLPLVPAPLVPAAGTQGVVSADKVTQIGTAQPIPTVLLTVDESETASIIEISVEFALTKQQVAAEETLQTAVTLGTRAANQLIEAEDLLLFQGDSVRRGDQADSLLFTSGSIQVLAGTGPGGLANVDDRDPAVDPALLRIPVDFVRGRGETETYGENTFARVAEAYSQLQDRGHYGPYALVLPTKAYADAFAPLENTLIFTAERLLPLVQGRLYGAGTVPEGIQVDGETKDVGVLLSLGGNTVDLVFAKAATTIFLLEDGRGLHFRVAERFALRDKDTTGRVALLFETRPTSPPAQPPA